MMRKVIDAVLTIGVLVGCVAMHEYKANADTTAYLDPDDNVVTMQQIADVVYYVENKYATGDIPITTAVIGDRTLVAQANGAGIVVNKWASTSTPEQLNAELSDDIASGLHNAGCSPVAAYAIHEAAHVIDFRRGLIGTKRLIANAPHMSGSIARYSFNADGSLNALEAVASSFQAVECGSATPADFQIYEMLVS
jgi:hypothetical protein